MHCIRLSPVSYPPPRGHSLIPYASGANFAFEIDSEELDQDSGWETVSTRHSSSGNESENERGSGIGSSEEDEDYYTPLEDGARSVAGRCEEEGEGTRGQYEGAISLGGGGTRKGTATATQNACAVEGYTLVHAERRNTDGLQLYDGDAHKLGARSGRGRNRKIPGDVGRGSDEESNTGFVSSMAAFNPVETTLTTADEDNAESNEFESGNKPSSIYSGSDNGISDGSEFDGLRINTTTADIRQGRSTSIFSIPNIPLKITSLGGGSDEYDSVDTSSPSSYASPPWGTTSRQVLPLFYSSDTSASPRGCLVRTKPKKGFRRKKRVSFHLENSSGDAADDENSSTPGPLAERHFPLCGGIIKTRDPDRSPASSPGRSARRSGSPSEKTTRTLESVPGLDDGITCDKVSLPSPNRKDPHFVCFSCGLTSLERLILDTAPLLGLTREELAAEVCSVDGDSISLEEVNHAWPSPRQVTAPLRFVSARVARIENVGDEVDLATLRPKLRSTSEWWRKRGGSKDLREEYGQTEQSVKQSRDHPYGDESPASTGSDLVRQAVRRFEDAARAVSEKEPNWRRRSGDDADEIRIRGSIAEMTLVDSPQRAQGFGACSGDTLLGYVEGLRLIAGASRKCQSLMEPPDESLAAGTSPKEEVTGEISSRSSSDKTSDLETPDPNPIILQTDIPPAAQPSTVQREVRANSTGSETSIVDNIEVSPSLSTRARPQNYSRPLSRVTLPTVTSVTNLLPSCPKQAASQLPNPTPLLQVRSRPDTPYPYRRLFCSSYAEASRLQHSRHHAWTIRKRAMAGVSLSALCVNRPESRRAVPRAPQSDLVGMHRYWREQVQLLDNHETSRKRTPVRYALLPSPCSSCSAPMSRSATPRPVTPLFRRSCKKLYRILSCLPTPRVWFSHRSEQWMLIKYPRALSRSYSRSGDWIKREEEVQRVLFRGDEDDDPGLSREIKITYSA